MQGNLTLIHIGCKPTDDFNNRDTSTMQNNCYIKKYTPKIIITIFSIQNLDDYVANQSCPILLNPPLKQCHERCRKRLYFSGVSLLAYLFLYPTFIWSFKQMFLNSKDIL